MTNLPKITSKKPLIALVLVFVLIVAVLSYSLWWRPSDNEYTLASQLVKSVDESSKTLTVELATIQYPGGINGATPIKLEVLSKTLTPLIDAVNENAALNRDFALSGVYNQHKSTLLEYKQSVNQLSDAIKKYVAALNSCRTYTNVFSEQSTMSYPDLLSACRAALASAKTSKHQAFNDQFLSKYTQLPMSI